MAYSDLQSRAFTQIAYMGLDEKYVDYCKANGTDSAPLSEILSTSQYEKLKNLGLTDAEINSWNISGVHDTNSQNGFYACIIETAPGEAAVGFRGSEDMGDLNNVANDWVGADIGLVNSTCTIGAVGDFVGDATEFVGDTIEYVGDVAGDFFEGAADVAEDVGDFLFGWIS